MSGGSSIGAALGGLAGFFFGGPLGFALGAALGAGVGGYLDPISLKTPSIGAPQVQQINIATAKEGDVKPELLGTSKITGNIIQYWRNRAIEIKETIEAGKGGGSSSQTVVTGYYYYLTWLQGICLGEADTLYAVYRGDKIVWFGELQRPASGGEETITLVKYSDDLGNGTTIGNMTFYFGTNDHAINTKFARTFDDKTLNSPHRNLCYAFFDDCFLGEANRLHVYSFIVGKRPQISFNSKETINTYDYNPAHAIWWIIEQMTDLPASFLDADSFSDVADTLYSENFGISILFNSKASANDYIDNILLHINGIKYYDTDGKIKIKLLRQDALESNMISITENDLLQPPTIARGSWNETVNEIRCVYPQRIVVSPETEEIALDFWTTGVIKRSTDGGTTWTDIETVPSEYGLVYDCISPKISNVLAGTSKQGAIFKSINSGLTWNLIQTIKTGVTTASIRSFVLMPNSDILVSIYDSSTTISELWRSEDDGDTWVLVNSSLPVLNPKLCLNGFGNLIGYSSLAKGVSDSEAGIWTSSDEGVTWTRLVDDAFNINSVIYIGNNTLIAGAVYDLYNTLIISTDNGLLWEDKHTEITLITPNELLFKRISETIVSLNTANSGPTRSFGYISEDAGDTWSYWQDFLGLASPTHAIEFATFFDGDVNRITARAWPICIVEKYA